MHPVRLKIRKKYTLAGSYSDKSQWSFRFLERLSLKWGLVQASECHPKFCDTTPGEVEKVLFVNGEKCMTSKIIEDKNNQL